MNLLYSFKGKAVAAVEGATHIPREGDWVFLNVTGTDELFRVRRVAWETEIAEGSKGKEGLARVHKESGNVFVMLESAEDAKGSSAASS